MSELNLYKNIMLLGSGIDVCIEKKLASPALILIYTGIDTVGWLDSNDEYSTRASFVNWVDAYLLKAKPLLCTSLDLYAARCGLLHTFTPDSKLSSTGKARRICYSWGTASAQDMQRTIGLTCDTNKFVAVHVNELYEAWRLGVGQFVADLDKNHNRKYPVYKKADKFFSELSSGVIRDFLATFGASQ